MASLKPMIQVAEHAVRDHVGTDVLFDNDHLLSSPLSSVPSDFDKEDRPEYPLAASSSSPQRGLAELETEENPEFRAAPTDPLEIELPPESAREGEFHALPASAPLSQEQKAPAIESEQTLDFPNGSTTPLEAQPPSKFGSDAVPNFENPAQPLQEQYHLNHQGYREPQLPSPATASSRKRPRPLECDEGSETEPVFPPSSPSKKQRADIDKSISAALLAPIGGHLDDSPFSAAASTRKRTWPLKFDEGSGINPVCPASPPSKKQRVDIDESNSAALSAPIRDTSDDQVLSSPPSASSLKQTQGIQEPIAPSERPSRKRAAPTRYDNELGSSSKSAKKAGPKAVNRSLRKGCWNADYLLQNPKSKLVYANLFGVLSDERAWTLLSSEEQRQLLAMLPEPVVTVASDGQALLNAFQEYLKNNNAFQADVRLFQEDLSAGRYDGKWHADAKAAMTKRAEGRFDGWKEQQSEAFWGQKQKLNHKAVAGDSTTCKLATLVAAQCFRVGDIWSYSRGFGRKKANAIVVEKEAKIIDISATNRLSFTFPPGQHKLSSPANGKDLVLKDISGPQQLSTAILQEDGRVTDPPNGNAWKDYRCWRDNQDMGSIWEIREAYYLRSNGMT